jgi:ATP-dependent Lon protease
MTAQEKDNSKVNRRVAVPPGALMILPLRQTVLFPSTVMPLVVGRAPSLQVVEEAVRQQIQIGFVAQRDPSIEVPRPEDLYSVGTAADVVRMYSLPDGQRQIIIQGRQRFEIAEIISSDPFLIARVTRIEENTPQSKEFQARIINLRQEAGKALALLPEPMIELKATIERIDDPLALIDIIASTLDLSLDEKQELLATLDPEQRAQKVAEKLARQISLLELSKKIGDQTKQSLDQAQRQYFLREQLKAIQKELGEDTGEKVEVEELRKKIADAKMTPQVETEVLRELSRFERMPEMAAERSMVRTYLDWMVELPWSVSSE